MRTQPVPAVLAALSLYACGPGVTEPQISCGQGTQLQGTTCEAIPVQMLRCGGNTVLSNGECVPTSTVCSPNLVFRSGRCEVPIPSPMVGQFIARTDLTVGAFATTFGWGLGVEHTFRFVGTELGQNSATAWANAQTAMVGNGLAWHVAGRIWAGESTDVQAAPVQNDTAADGSCLPTAQPQAAGGIADREIHIGLFSWNGGVATPVACAKVGSVTFRPSPRSIIVNVQLGDGTVLDRTLGLPFSN